MARTDERDARSPLKDEYRLENLTWETTLCPEKLISSESHKTWKSSFEYFIDKIRECNKTYRKMTGLPCGRSSNRPHYALHPVCPSVRPSVCISRACSQIVDQKIQKVTGSGGARVFATQGKRLCCRPCQSHQFCNQSIFSISDIGGVN